jgi:hypothetical protein
MTTVFIAFICINLHAQERPTYKIVAAKGKSYLDRSKAQRGQLAKVGNTFKAHGDKSNIDITFLGAIFRLVNGQLTIIESNPHKRSPEKMLLEDGKVYFYVDQRLEKNIFHLATNRFILTVRGEDLKSPVRGYVEVQKEKATVNVLSGHLDVTIARINKKYLIPLKAGQLLESNGKDNPIAQNFSDELKTQKLLNVISQFETSAH